MKSQIRQNPLLYKVSLTFDASATLYIEYLCPYLQNDFLSCLLLVLYIRQRQRAAVMLNVRRVVLVDVRFLA